MQTAGPHVQKAGKTLFPFSAVSLSTCRGGILTCDLLLCFLELRDIHWACVDPHRCPQPTRTTQHAGTCPPAPGPCWGTVQRKSPGGGGGGADGAARIRDQVLGGQRQAKPRMSRGLKPPAHAPLSHQTLLKRHKISSKIKNFKTVTVEHETPSAGLCADNSVTHP